MSTNLRTMVCSALIASPLAGRAAENEPQGFSFWNSLDLLLPMIVVFGIMLAFVPLMMRRVMKNPQMQRAEEHMLRNEEHMKRVEAQLKRIADALEKRDKDGDNAP